MCEPCGRCTPGTARRRPGGSAARSGTEAELPASFRHCSFTGIGKSIAWRWSGSAASSEGGSALVHKYGNIRCALRLRYRIYDWEY